MTDLEILSQRLYNVESQYRRLQRLAILGGILVSAVLVMGQANPRSRPLLMQDGRITPAAATPQRPEVVEDKIRARHFVLMDAKGKERASIVADGAGSAFFLLFDENERPRAQMSVGPYGPAINFYDPSGKARTIIGSTTLVSSHVANAAGVVERNPPSSIVLFDREGKVLWRTP